PCALATAAVLSFDPSDTTTSAVLSPQIVGGSASTTMPITSASLKAAITIATGGSARAASPDAGEKAAGAALSIAVLSTLGRVTVLPLLRRRGGRIRATPLPARTSGRARAGNPARGRQRCPRSPRASPPAWRGHAPPGSVPR